MAEHSHDGHRARMRKRFQKTELAGFQPHEILEMLLFYAIPRKNTNQIAHRLMARFHSLRGVLCADPDALLEVEEMTESAVIFLTFLRALYHYDMDEEFVGKEMQSTKDVDQYFIDRYKLERNEVVLALLLDDSLQLVRCVTVSKGHPSASEISVRRLTELAVNAKCSHIILAHNHPNGTADPSDADISVTRQLFSALKPVGIRLIDHVVVGGGKVTSLRECGAFIGLG